MPEKDNKPFEEIDKQIAEQEQKVQALQKEFDEAGEKLVEVRRTEDEYEKVTLNTQVEFYQKQGFKDDEIDREFMSLKKELDQTKEKNIQEQRDKLEYDKKENALEEAKAELKRLQEASKEKKAPTKEEKAPTEEKKNPEKENKTDEKKEKASQPAPSNGHSREDFKNLFKESMKLFARGKAVFGDQIKFNMDPQKTQELYGQYAPMIQYVMTQMNPNGFSRIFVVNPGQVPQINGQSMGQPMGQPAGTPMGQFPGMPMGQPNAEQYMQNAAKAAGITPEQLRTFSQMMGFQPMGNNPQMQPGMNPNGMQAPETPNNQPAPDQNTQGKEDEKKKEDQKNQEEEQKKKEEEQKKKEEEKKKDSASKFLGELSDAFSEVPMLAMLLMMLSGMAEGVENIRKQAKEAKESYHNFVEKAKELHEKCKEYMKDDQNIIDQAGNQIDNTMDEKEQEAAHKMNGPIGMYQDLLRKQKKDLEEYAKKKDEEKSRKDHHPEKAKQRSKDDDKIEKDRYERQKKSNGFEM